MANTRMTYPRAPRRRVEKVTAQVVNTITNSITNAVLHTCEDAKTLVRVIMEGDFTPIAGGAYGWVLVKEPQGSAVVTPSAGTNLDVDESDLLLVRGSGGFGASAVENTHISIDSKGQRKLKVGDEIVLRHVGDTATMGTFAGTITMIFKE